MSRRFCLSLLPALLVVPTLLQAGPDTRPNGPVTTLETEHVTLVAAVSHESVSPGQRFSLVFDITPRRGVHVYAPGKHAYRIVRFTLDAQSWLQTHPVTYPKSEIYHFVPLGEFVEVYQRAFTLVQDVTVIQPPHGSNPVAAGRSVTLSGRLEYQACDDKLCYMPKTVPVAWTLDWREE
jgi:hypothetical protein